MRLAAVLTALAVSPFTVPAAQAAAGPSPAPSVAPSPGAKPAAPAPPPSSQARALSRALVPPQTWNRLLDRSAKGLSDAISQSLATKGQQVPGGLQAKVRDQLGQRMQYDTAVDDQAQALQKRFSPAEMESAARFYSSPIGKKMLEQLPDAQSEVGEQLQQQLAVVVPDIVHRVAPALAQPGEGGAGGPAGPQQAPPAGGPSAAEGVGSSGSRP